MHVTNKDVELRNSVFLTVYVSIICRKFDLMKISNKLKSLTIQIKYLELFNDLHCGYHDGEP